MATEGLYPLSTQDGRSIPLDIIKPSGVIFWNLVQGVEKVVTIPAGFEVCYCYSTTNCLFRNSDITFGVPVEDTVYSDGGLILAEVPTIINLTPGASRRIYPISSGGVLYLTALYQWAALVQDLQARIG